MDVIYDCRYHFLSLVINNNIVIQVFKILTFQFQKTSVQNSCLVNLLAEFSLRRSLMQLVLSKSIISVVDKFRLSCGKYFIMSAVSFTVGPKTCSTAGVDISKMCAAHQAIDKHVKVILCHLDNFTCGHFSLLIYYCCLWFILRTAWYWALVAARQLCMVFNDWVRSKPFYCLSSIYFCSLSSYILIYSTKNKRREFVCCLCANVISGTSADYRLQTNIGKPRRTP